MLRNFMTIEENCSHLKKPGSKESPKYYQQSRNFFSQTNCSTLNSLSCANVRQHIDHGFQNGIVQKTQADRRRIIRFIVEPNHDVWSINRHTEYVSKVDPGQMLLRLFMIMLNHVTTLDHIEIKSSSCNIGKLPRIVSKIFDSTELDHSVELTLSAVTVRSQVMNAKGLRT